MNFTQVLNRRHVNWRPHRTNPGNIWINCIFCRDRGQGPDTKYRLGVDLIEHQAHCFNCGWTWKRRRPGLQGFLLRRMSFGEDVQELTVSTAQHLPPPQPVATESLPTDFDFADKDADAMAYLRHRGLTEQQIYNSGVGTSRSGRAAYRVVFPKWKGEGVEWWAARDWTGNQKPPWLMSTGPKGLYGEVGPSVVLVEGVFDQFSVARAGFTCAAMMGTAITDDLAGALAEAEEITLWTDPDRAGFKAVREAADAWMGIKHLRVVKKGTPEPGDVRDVSLVREYIETAEALSVAALLKWQLGSVA